MGLHPIPINSVWDYLKRFNLPDWWEPVLLAIDNQIVRQANKSDKD